MLRYRAVELCKKKILGRQRELAKTDRNGRLAGLVAPLANWANNRRNGLTRPPLEKVFEIDRRAALPRYHGRTFVTRSKRLVPPIDYSAPPSAARRSSTRPVSSITTIRTLARRPARSSLPHRGRNRSAVFPVLRHAATRAGQPRRGRQIGFRGCSDARPPDRLRLRCRRAGPVLRIDAQVRMAAYRAGQLRDREALQSSVRHQREHVDIARKEGLAPGLSPLEGGVTVHLACHARAQNIGQKATEMLRLLPGSDVTLIERCSGHGGLWGVLKENFETAVKVGRPVARQALRNAKPFLSSECPLPACISFREWRWWRQAKCCPGATATPDRIRCPLLRDPRNMV